MFLQEVKVPTPDMRVGTGGPSHTPCPACAVTGAPQPAGAQGCTGSDVERHVLTEAGLLRCSRQAGWMSPEEGWAGSVFILLCYLISASPLDGEHEAIEVGLPPFWSFWWLCCPHLPGIAGFQPGRSRPLVLQVDADPSFFMPTCSPRLGAERGLQATIRGAGPPQPTCSSPRSAAGG